MAFRIFYSEACAEHDLPGHPERPERVRKMMVSLQEQFPRSCFSEATACNDEDILLFHTTRHLKVLKDKCKRAEKTRRAQPIDPDTAVMFASRAAIYHATGAAINAVDAIYSSNTESGIKAAFCCTRPPGHHAERNTSMGFCFVNNAGVAARYAQSKYGVGNVAVVDFDVHHGNGIEEGFTSDRTLFYGSTHEKDNYPGTGREPTKKGDEASELDRRIVNRFLSKGEISKEQFRIKWAEIMAEMLRFAPELVIISAGFDAHKDDPLGGCSLEEEDFAWATQAVLDVCNKLNADNPVPCISVLEGGYNVTAIARSAVAHCEVLSRWAGSHEIVRSNDLKPKASVESATNLPDNSDALSLGQAEIGIKYEMSAAVVSEAADDIVIVDALAECTDLEIADILFEAFEDLRISKSSCNAPKFDGEEACVNDDEAISHCGIP